MSVEIMQKYYLVVKEARCRTAQLQLVMVMKQCILVRNFVGFLENSSATAADLLLH